MIRPLVLAAALAAACACGVKGPPRPSYAPPPDGGTTAEKPSELAPQPPEDHPGPSAEDVEP